MHMHLPVQLRSSLDGPAHCFVLIGIKINAFRDVDIDIENTTQDLLCSKERSFNSIVLHLNISKV
jgi:hypothetical protein